MNLTNLATGEVWNSFFVKKKQRHTFTGQLLTLINAIIKKMFARDKNKNYCTMFHPYNKLRLSGSVASSCAAISACNCSMR